MSERLIDVPEEQILPLNINDYAPKEQTIGMMGFPGSGKTTFISVFHYIVNRDSQIFGVDASLEEGVMSVRRNLSVMLQEHRFPDKTALGALETTKLVMTRKGKVTLGGPFNRLPSMGNLLTKKLSLQVNDLSGEFVRNLVESDDDPTHLLLTAEASPGSVVGKYAFLFFAKAFVVVIDCGTFSNWEIDQLDYTKLLQVMVKAKHSERLSLPLAFIFTKFDMLPPDKQGMEGADLLRGMSILDNYVKTHFKLDRVRAFVANIAVERDQSGQPKVDDKGSHIPKSPIEVHEADFKDFIEWAFRWL